MRTWPPAVFSSVNDSTGNFGASWCVGLQIDHQEEFVMHQTFDWIFFAIMIPPALIAAWDLSRTK
jgi:hypothetical protein